MLRWLGLSVASVGVAAGVTGLRTTRVSGERPKNSDASAGALKASNLLSATPD